jgi:cell division septation protein DedD
MAEFNDVILKEEEQFGGYNPGEPDDDSFFLNHNPYPGDMSKFIDIVKDTETIEDLETEIFERDIPPTPTNIDNSDVNSPDTLNDPDLVGYVKGLMSVSKRKSKQKETDGIEIEKRDFVPIEGDEVQTNVNISELNLDKPSLAAINEKPIKSVVDDKNESNNLFAESVLNPVIEELNEENSVEKENNKSPMFLWIALVAATILIVGTSILYLLNINPFKPDSLRDSKIVKNTDSINQKIQTKKSEIVPNINDTVNKIASNFDNNDIDTLKISPVDSSKNIKKPDLTKSKEDLVVKNIENKSIKISTEQPKNSNIFKPETDKVTKKGIVKNTSEKVNNNTKSNSIAEVKPQLKEDISLIRERALDETFVPTDEPGVYIVQIYSSLSKDDAQNWLNKLKSKNVPDAFITTQNIRDKVWYRVRFGNYRTREEAKNAALRYGYAQTWIDRLK